MPNETDWNILTRLFEDDGAGFRHQMGLRRSSTTDFFAASDEGDTIRAEKEAILCSVDGERHLLATGTGEKAFQEFARWLGPCAGLVDDGLETGRRHRELTLRLEPDWLLIGAPDWRVEWASVCFPTRWSLEGKAGLPVTAIHAVVPGLNEQIGRHIQVFFDRLMPGEGWGRANWGLSTNDARNQHPSLPYAPLTNQTPVEQVWLRVESQHFCKLPETVAVLFGIRILHFALPEVMAKTGSVAGLRERLRTMPIEVAAYKGVPVEFWRQLEG